MNWNNKSVAKEDFQIVRSTEEHISLFNNDIITRLISSIEVPVPLFDNYTFISSYMVDNTGQEGASLFYKY